MISALTISIMCGVPILLSVMLLPSILELRKPNDAGPRLIVPEDLLIFAPVAVEPVSLLNLEEYHELDVSLKPFIDVILGRLPTLES